MAQIPNQNINNIQRTEYYYPNQINEYNNNNEEEEQQQLLDEKQRKKKKVGAIIGIVIGVVVVVIIIIVIIVIVYNNLSRSSNSSSSSDSSGSESFQCFLSPPAKNQKSAFDKNVLNYFMGLCVDNDGGKIVFIDGSVSNNYQLFLGSYDIIEKKWFYSNPLFTPPSMFHNNFNISIADNYLISGNVEFNEFVGFDFLDEKVYFPFAINSKHTKRNVRKGVTISNDGSTFAIGVIDPNKTDILQDPGFTVDIYTKKNSQPESVPLIEKINNTPLKSDIIALSLNENGNMLVYCYNNGVDLRTIKIVLLLRAKGTWIIQTRKNFTINNFTFYSSSKLITTDETYENGLFFLSQYNASDFCGSLYIYKITSTFDIMEYQVINSVTPTKGDQFSIAFDVQMNDDCINALYISSPKKTIDNNEKQGQIEIFILNKDKKFIPYKINNDTYITLETNPQTISGSNFGYSLAIARKTKSIFATALFKQSSDRSLLYEYT